MKKKSTVVNQPDKTEAIKPEVLMPQNHIRMAGLNLRLAATEGPLFFKRAFTA